MPFAAPFRKYAPGDLVYGVHKGIMKMGRQDYIKRVFKAGPGATIDEYPALSSDSKSFTNDDTASFIATLGTHPKYSSSIGGSDNEATRRKDKGGLYWATMVAHKHVHFVLDGLDIKGVILKSFSGKNSDRPVGKPADDFVGTKNRSITGSELRWVYRNRHVKDVQDHVQFWFFDEQVVPPWEIHREFGQGGSGPMIVESDGAALWSQYTPSS